MPIFFWLVPRSMKWRLAEVPDGSDCREGRSPSGPKVSCLRDTFWGWCTTNKARQAASQSSHTTWPHDKPPQLPFSLRHRARACCPALPPGSGKEGGKIYKLLILCRRGTLQFLKSWWSSIAVACPRPPLLAVAKKQTKKTQSPTTEILLSHTLKPREKKRANNNNKMLGRDAR